ncbi:MAG: hypothetical protein P8127_17680, partial [Acidobacteriota bacterium]
MAIDCSCHWVPVRLARGSQEIASGVVKRHVLGDIPVAIEDAADEAEPKGRVRNFVAWRGTGRQNPVLDPQMGLAVRYAVTDTVPPVDGAVVEAQGLQARRASVLELFERIVFDVCRNERTEAGDVLLKNLQRRRLDPMAAETHAG